jgi:hypothetical protein
MVQIYVCQESKPSCPIDSHRVILRLMGMDTKSRSVEERKSPFLSLTIRNLAQIELLSARSLALAINTSNLYSNFGCYVLLQVSITTLLP